VHSKPPSKSPAIRPSLNVVGPEMDALRGFQAHTIEALDTKAGVVLGFSGTILAVFAVVQGSEHTFFSLTGFVLLCTAVVLGVFAMLPRSFRFDPKPGVLLNDYMLRPPDVPTTGAKEQILADKVEAYSKNEALLDRKASLVNAAVICLGVGILFVSAHTLRRNVMTNDKMPPNEKTAPNPKPAAPAPVAQPNPDASNIIRKGMDKLPLQK